MNWITLALAIGGAICGAALFAVFAPMGAIMLMHAFAQDFFRVGPEAAWGLLAGPPFVLIGLAGLLLVRVAARRIGPVVWAALAILLAGWGLFYGVAWVSNGVLGERPAALIDLALYFILALIFSAVAIRGWRRVPALGAAGKPRY